MRLCAAANFGLWRSVTERGSHPTGSVTGCAARHEARHSPRLRLAPPCSHPRPRPGVAELRVVRPLDHTMPDEPYCEVASGKELRQKYGLTAENRPTIHLDASRIPEQL